LYLERTSYRRRLLVASYCSINQPLNRTESTFPVPCFFLWHCSGLRYCPTVCFLTARFMSSAVCSRPFRRKRAVASWLAAVIAGPIAVFYCNWPTGPYLAAFLVGLTMRTANWEPRLQLFQAAELPNYERHAKWGLASQMDAYFRPACRKSRRPL
jgi:hypothetical protein